MTQMQGACKWGDEARRIKNEANSNDLASNMINKNLEVVFFINHKPQSTISMQSITSLEISLKTTR